MQLPSALPPGTTLTLQPSAQQHAPAQVQQDVQLLDLKPQQIIQASVVRGGLDQAELEIGRQRFKAATRVALATGQRIQAQVVRTSPFIELRLIDHAALNHLFQTLHLFHDSFDIAGLLQRSGLGRMLGGFAWGGHYEQATQQAGEILGSGSNLDGQGLAGLLGLMGLDLEGLLAKGQVERAATTIKAVLLALAQAQDMDGMPDDQDGSVKGQAKHLLDQVELFQACRARLAQLGKDWLPLILPFVDQGYLVAERQKRDSDPGGEQGEEAWSVGLFLKMSVLGTLNIHVTQSGPGLNVRVLCETPQVAKRFEAAREEFKASIQALPVNSLHIGLGAEDPVQHLLHLVVPKGQRSFEAWV